MGRVRGFPVARGGAQKFKEISLPARRGVPDLEAQARAARAGSPPEVPTVAIVPDDELTGRNVAALHEIAARRGPLVVVTHEGSTSGGGRRRAGRRTEERA